MEKNKSIKYDELVKILYEKNLCIEKANATIKRLKKENNLLTKKYNSLYYKYKYDDDNFRLKQ